MVKTSRGNAPGMDIVSIVFPVKANEITGYRSGGPRKSHVRREKTSDGEKQNRVENTKTLKR